MTCLSLSGQAFLHDGEDNTIKVPITEKLCRKTRLILNKFLGIKTSSRAERTDRCPGSEAQRSPPCAPSHAAIPHIINDQENRP